MVDQGLLLGPVALVFLAGSFIAAVVGSVYYQRLQRHRAPDAPPSAFRITPLYLFDEELFTPAGQGDRRRVLQAMSAMVGLFFAGVIAGLSGW